MAPIKPTSGFTADYTDPNSGITIINAWTEISTILYVPSNYCMIAFDVYKDEAAKDSGMSPVFPNITNSEYCNSNNWNLFFDVSVMDQPNRDIQKQAIAYLLAIRQLT